MKHIKNFNEAKKGVKEPVLKESEPVFKHNKSVTSKILDAGSVAEYDKYDRMTYYKDSNGYWTLKFYDEPTITNKNATPYQVVHKYWEHYNK